MKFRCSICDEEFDEEMDAFMHVGYGHGCIKEAKEDGNEVTTEEREEELREAGFGGLVDEIKKGGR